MDSMDYCGERGIPRRRGKSQTELKRPIGGNPYIHCEVLSNKVEEIAKTSGTGLNPWVNPPNTNYKGYRSCANKSEVQLGETIQKVEVMAVGGGLWVFPMEAGK